MISSRSSEISRMATPALRCSISTWRMYSVALMSTPRVGWEAIRTTGRRESSRARISFCTLPPERFLTGVSAEGVLMLKRLINPRVWAAIAPKSRKIPRANGSLAWVCRIRFSATEKTPIVPCRLRSSGMKDSPAASRSLTGAWVISRPARRIAPPLTGRSPAIDSASSRCPLPETPAMPTISPAWTSSVTPCRAGSPWSLSTVRPSSARRTSPGLTAGRSGWSLTSRPTIIRASVRCSMPSLGTVSTTRPSRMTVIRSHSACTSYSLWEMKIRAWPWSRIWRSVPNSSSTSCGVRTAVGSSRMISAPPR